MVSDHVAITPDAAELIGQGSLDQVRRDLDALAELGATHVLFDIYPGSPGDAAGQDAA